MSITKLKAARDTVLSQGIGVYLPVVKMLIAAIDEHIGEDNAATLVESPLQDQATVLQAEVVHLKEEVGALKQPQTVQPTLSAEQVAAIEAEHEREVANSIASVEQLNEVKATEIK